MNIINVENVSKSYGEKSLFKDISFTINDKDKIGLIGVNGTGKSTLLKIISKLERSDSGNIHYLKNISIEYLSQTPVFNSDYTVIEQILKDTSQKTNDTDSFNIESQAKTILTKLGITEFDKKISLLSGGQKKRLAIAKALISPSDLLVLDEPTNHLDNKTIEWLEKYIKGRKGALIMVTHDRYFLDNVANKTYELEDNKLYSYEGNYSVFVEKKIERQILQNTIEQKRQNLYKKELEWIRKGAKARSTKQKARIQRFEDIKNAKVDTIESKINISVGQSRLGKKIIELNNICKSFLDNNIIDDFSYIFLKTDRIGIVGSSGIGKSTLLKCIIGELPLDRGSIDKGSTVTIGYFSQESEYMDTSLRAIDYIKETAEYIKTADGSHISASQMMENFLFDSDMQYSYIHTLSGGEKRRLYLLKILMTEPNVLILDEPTNDLDIDTLKVLESYIDEFGGTVLAVSHDRYFLDRICNKIFSFEGNGAISVHTGNYNDYLSIEKEKIKDTTPKKQNKDSYKQNNKKLKFTYKEKIEYEGIDAKIENLEEELSELEAEIAKNATDFVRLTELSNKKDALEEELLYAMERQEYLMNLEEKITNANKK